MAWSPLLLSLLTLCQGAWTQSLLTQPASSSGSLGETVSIPCIRSTGSISDSYVQWYQQHQGGRLRLIIHRDNQRPSGIPERFSGSKDTSSNSASLTISGLQTEDEADYYCQSGDSNHVFGEGTRLTILGQPKASPFITAFARYQPEGDTQKATLVCMINGFYPSTVDVAWTKDGSPVTQGVMTSPPVRQNDNKYWSSSFLSLSTDEWVRGRSYTCKVTHEGQVFQKELSSTQGV